MIKGEAAVGPAGGGVSSGEYRFVFQEDVGARNRFGEPWEGRTQPPVMCHCSLCSLFVTELVIINGDYSPFSSPGCKSQEEDCGLLAAVTRVRYILGLLLRT